MSEWKKVKLSEVSSYVKDKIPITSTDESLYVSTDSMLKDKAGIIPPESIPSSGSITLYRHGDILVSNIRPYFKKIWFANRIGGCSNDVLVFRAKREIEPRFLYYILSEDTFFEHMMAGANGTKMPRGNKKLILNYTFTLPSTATQDRIATTLSRYDTLIENYQKQIKLLEEAAHRLYKEWFVDLRFPGHESTKIVEGVPEGWRIKRLAEVAVLKAGGDRPSSFSKDKTDEMSVPVFSNGSSNEGLYGYTDKAEIFEHSITISARGSVGYTVLRRFPYVPIVRLISIVPTDIYVGYLYFYITKMPIDSNGAAQQQITVPMIKDKKIIVPSNYLLDAFKEKEEFFFVSIEKYRKSIALLSEARDRLLPKLMSGEIEIK